MQPELIFRFFVETFKMWQKIYISRNAFSLCSQRYRSVFDCLTGSVSGFLDLINGWKDKRQKRWLEILKNAIYAHPKENLHRNPSKHSFFRLRRSKNTFPKQQLFPWHNWIVFTTFSCILNEKTSNINVFSYKKSLFLALYMAMPIPKFLKISAIAIYTHRYIYPYNPVLE